MGAREDILSRIRTALVDVPPGEEPGEVYVPRDYQRSHLTSSSVVDVFAERVADYRATVALVPVGGAAAEVERACSGLIDVVIAPGFPVSWLPSWSPSLRASSLRASSLEHLPTERLPSGGFVADDPPLDVDELDRAGAAVTTAAIGIALTGTIVLDAGSGQGRRALTLVPDMHICVIPASRIVADVPDALARLDPSRPLTFISGPSATSDIELQRVEGVHGPRTLHVIIVDDLEGSA